MNENEIGRRAAERAAKAGFTLVEIIIAIAIVGIMAAVAVPNINKNTDDLNDAFAKIQILLHLQFK